MSNLRLCSSFLPLSLHRDLTSESSPTIVIYNGKPHQVCVQPNGSIKLFFSIIATRSVETTEFNR